MAEPENWDYRLTKSDRSKPILYSYLRYTFARLEEEDKVQTTPDGLFAAFNTGLVTINQKEIYAFFRPNPKPDRQPWKLIGFRQGTDRDFLSAFGGSLPALADYFEDPTVLLYDRRLELHVNIDHVLERIDRFPESLAIITTRPLSSSRAQKCSAERRGYTATTRLQFLSTTGVLCSCCFRFAC